MNFGGHLMAGWLIANGSDFSRGERRAITLMAVAADLDGLLMYGPAAGREWHRTFSHNIFFAILVPMLVLLFLPSGRRSKIVPWLYLGMFSHFVLDLLVTGWWILTPFWPISAWGILMTDWIPEYVMKYYIQLGLFAVLLVPCVRIIIRHKRTPLEVLGKDVDVFIQRFVSLPFVSRCALCRGRAFYRCDECGAPLCGSHRRFAGFLKISCRDKEHVRKEKIS